MDKWRKIAEENGINPNTYISRITYGWTPEKAATKAVRSISERDDNKYIKIAKKNDISRGIYIHRVDELFWSREEASTRSVMSKEEVSALGSKAKSEYREIQNQRDFNDKNNLFKLTPQHLEIAKGNGIKKRTARSRVARNGWTVQEAITIPVKRPMRPKGYLKYLEIAKANDIRPETYRGRIKKGWSLSNAATIAPDLANSKRRADYELIKLAQKNGIKRSTYMSRLKRGWAKKQASTVPILGQGEYLNEQTQKEAVEGFKRLRKR